jgi:hypothetical protein
MSMEDSPAPPSPPRKETSGKRKAYLAAAVVLTLIIVALLAAYPVLFPKPQPTGSIPPETTLGLRVNQTSPGNWTIYISGGSRKASSVRLNVIIPTTAVTTVNKVVSALTPAKNNPDAVFNDSNANSKMDAGDTIILKASGGHIVAGYKVQFLQGQELIGTIRELPAEIG